MCHHGAHDENAVLICILLIIVTYTKDLSIDLASSIMKLKCTVTNKMFYVN